MNTKDLEIFKHITEPGHMNIIKSGGTLNFYNEEITILKTLEPGKIYNLDVDYVYNTLSLKPASDLQVPKKIYDFEQDFREQILTTLRNKSGNNNIGVLLEGYKGQGKSVAAKQLAIESGLPVIIINSKIPSSINFSNYLGNIKQDHVLFIDEFEKLFQDEERGNQNDNEKKMHTQNSFLSLFDGAQGLEHKRLVILTANKPIGDKFINRPSRIRYYKKYNFMSKEVFKAILEDKLEDKQFFKDLEDNINISSCTIDILTSIIEEINIQKKPYSSFKHFFNHKEKDIVYIRYKKNAEGKYEYFDELTLKKELDKEDLEKGASALGYDIKILAHEEDKVIFYERKEWVQSDNEDEDDKQISIIYKIIKSENPPSKVF